MLLSLTLAAPPAAAQELVFTIDAPPSLGPVAARIRNIDSSRLVDALGRAGLTPPADPHITLIPNDDARARATSSWIAAQAFGSRGIIIFPDRIGTYPHDSLEAVVRHEVVHLALFTRAGGRPLPRWFHEGTAVSVEEGWGIANQVRLLLATRSHRSLAELERLFRSQTQPDTHSAYLLASALVSDLRRRHGPAAPGAIAALVGDGVPFDEAFSTVTGDTPEAAAASAWDPYRRWASWMPVLTGGTFLWFGIVVLAVVAFAASLRRRAAQRRRWDEEEERNKERNGDPDDEISEEAHGAQAESDDARSPRGQ